MKKKAYFSNSHLTFLNFFLHLCRVLSSCLLNLARLGPRARQPGPHAAPQGGKSANWSSVPQNVAMKFGQLADNGWAPKPTRPSILQQLSMQLTSWSPVFITSPSRAASSVEPKLSPARKGTALLGWPSSFQVKLCRKQFSQPQVQHHTPRRIERDLLGFGYSQLRRIAGLIIDVLVSLFVDVDHFQSKQNARRCGGPQHRFKSKWKQAECPSVWGTTTSFQVKMNTRILIIKMYVILMIFGTILSKNHQNDVHLARFGLSLELPCPSCTLHSTSRPVPSTQTISRTYVELLQTATAAPPALKSIFRKIRFSKNRDFGFSRFGFSRFEWDRKLSWFFVFGKPLYEHFEEVHFTFPVLQTLVKPSNL